MSQDSALKDVLKAVSDGGVLGSMLKGGFSFSEFPQLIQVGQDVSLIMGESAQVEQQYLALDDAGRADLDAYVASLPNFPANQQVDGVAKKVLDVVIALSPAINALKGS